MRSGSSVRCPSIGSGSVAITSTLMRPGGCCRSRIKRISPSFIQASRYSEGAVDALRQDCLVRDVRHGRQGGAALSRRATAGHGGHASRARSCWSWIPETFGPTPVATWRVETGLLRDVGGCSLWAWFVPDRCGAKAPDPIWIHVWRFGFRIAPDEWVLFSGNPASSFRLNAMDALPPASSVDRSGVGRLASRRRRTPDDRHFR